GKRVVGLDKNAEAVLMANPWQGNVRELQNTMERAVILLRGDSLTAQDLAFVSGGGPFATGLDSGGGNGASAGSEFVIPASGFNVEGHEKDLLMQALDRHNGNKSRAAK